MSSSGETIAVRDEPVGCRELAEPGFQFRPAEFSAHHANDHPFAERPVLAQVETGFEVGELFHQRFGLH